MELLTCNLWCRYRFRCGSTLAVPDLPALGLDTVLIHVESLMSPRASLQLQSGACLTAFRQAPCSLTTACATCSTKDAEHSSRLHTQGYCGLKSQRALGCDA